MARLGRSRPIQALIRAIRLGAAAPPPASITVTHRNTTTSTANDLTYTTDSFTPAAGTLLLFMMAIGASDDADIPTVTASANGLTFSFVQVVERGGIDAQWLFVADQMVPASPSAMTITWTTPLDAGTGAVMFVAEIGGIVKTGTAAILQTAENFGPAGTPTATFASAPLTGNPQIAWMQNILNPAGIAPPAGFTEYADAGYDTPIKGAEYAVLVAGSTTSAVTWSESTSTAWSAIIAEIDASGGGSPPADNTSNFFQFL